MQPNKQTKRVLNSVLLSFVRENNMQLFFWYSKHSPGRQRDAMFLCSAETDSPRKFLLVHLLPVELGSSYVFYTLPLNLSSWEKNEHSNSDWDEANAKKTRQARFLQRRQDKNDLSNVG